MKWLKLFWLFIRVAAMDFKRSWLEARNRRLRENQRRPWKAHSPHGVVDLGTVTYAQALSRAGKLGVISYTDMEHGFIFYNTQQGGPAASGMRQ